MIKKQNIWFVSLFSIILVLSIIYIGLNENTINELKNTVYEEYSDSELVLNESTELVALRVQSDEEMENKINSYKEILLSLTATIDEKNEAYENLLQLNSNKGLEKEVESLILKKLNLESFAKILGNNITIVVNKKDHSYELANSVIRTVQSKFKEDKYITVKFN
ncbi:MAG: hypothetical protein ACI4WW_06445 [Candidatus Coprovivens sp.]